MFLSVVILLVDAWVSVVCQSVKESRVMLVVLKAHPCPTLCRYNKLTVLPDSVRECTLLEELSLEGNMLTELPVRALSVCISVDLCYTIILPLVF